MRRCSRSLISSTSRSMRSRCATSTDKTTVLNAASRMANKLPSTITNVVRHAQAKSVSLRLRLEPASFTLEIEDDGLGLGGLDPKAAQTRNGLRNMRKRMEDIGGSFFMGPAPERGAVIRLTAPLPAQTS